MTRSFFVHDDVPIVANGVLNPAGTLTRASVGRALQSDGDYAERVVNAQRIEPDGLLIEEASATEVIRSCAFGSNDSDWSSPSEFIITPAVSIFKGQTAWRHQNKGTGAARSRAQAIGVLTAGSETSQLFVENDPDNPAAETEIALSDTTAGGSVTRIKLTWSTGAVVVTATTVGTPDNFYAEKLSDLGPSGGEVYRIVFSATANNPGNGRSAFIFPTGVGTNTEAVIIHCHQHEEKAFATSPMVSDVTFTSRAGTGWAFDANGVLQEYGTNVERPQYLFNSTTGLWEGGNVLNEAASTNKCTNFNANPTDLTGLQKAGDAAATLTVVDDTTALFSAGLDQVCTSGKVFKLDNSAGTTPAIASSSALTGNTNVHALSVYIRGSGTGDLRTGFTLPSDSAFTLTSDYVRKTASQVSLSAGALNSADPFRIVVNAGGVCYFILNQLEESDTVSTPIVVAGSAVTRPADVTASVVASRALDSAVITDLSTINFDITKGTISGEIDIDENSPNFGRLANFNNGSTNNELRLQINAAGQLIWRLEVAGVQSALVSAGVLASTVTEFVSTYDDTRLGLSVNGGAFVYSNYVAGAPTSLTQFNLGTTGVLTSPINAHVKNLTYRPSVDA